MPRYLFLDDEPIAEQRGLTRTVHSAVKHPDNPIFVGERPWEGAVSPSTILFDDEEGLFKLWYGTFARVPGALGTFVSCYATSADGLHWDRPDLDAIEFEGSTRNNLCAVDTGGLSVLKDRHERDPARRYKALYWGAGRSRSGAFERSWMGSSGGSWGICVAFSPDGTHWTKHADNPVLTGTGDTQSIVGWDERYGKYVAYIRPGRHDVKGRRAGIPRRVIGRAESDDFVTWTEPLTVLVPDADDALQAEHYAMHVRPYHGHDIGLLHLFVPSPDPIGPFWAELASSRDGIRWRRLGDHQPFIALGEPGSFDCGMVSAAGGMLEIGDELWFYYGGWNEDHGTSRRHRRMESDRQTQQRAAGIGLARLRRDGFVSLDAGPEEGTLLSRTVACNGRQLVVNARTATGFVGAELVDEGGRPIDGYGRAECDPFVGDSVAHVITWNGCADLERLRGETLSVRFRLRNAELYAFAVEGSD